MIICAISAALKNNHVNCSVVKLFHFSWCYIYNKFPVMVRARLMVSSQFWLYPVSNMLFLARHESFHALLLKLLQLTQENGDKDSDILLFCCVSLLHFVVL